MENIEFETVLAEASRLPLVKIDREFFLRKELRDKYSNEVVDKAIKYSPAYAGIDVEEINKIAKSCINAETTRVTALSAAAGIPGGLAMVGTVPADFTQYFAHILRILQELVYLYSWPDLELDSSEMSEETKNILILFVGIMFGVNTASVAVTKIAANVAKQVAKKLPQKALTKGIIYPIVKKVASLIGVKMTKELFAKSVSKAIPILGAGVAGTLTYVTFKPMSEKLRSYLASCEVANVNTYIN